MKQKYFVYIGFLFGLCIIAYVVDKDFLEVKSLMVPRPSGEGQQVGQRPGDGSGNGFGKDTEVGRRNDNGVGNRVDSHLVPHYEGCITFYHIPKTGGTTMRSILFEDAKGRGFSFKWSNGLAEVISPQRVRVLVGHCPLEDLLAMAPTRELACPFITIYREPVDRFFSKFYFKNSWGDDLNAFIMSDSFEEEVIRFQYFREESEMRQLENLIESDFLLIGLTERFDEMLILLRDYGLLEKIQYLKYRVIGGRPSINILTRPARARLEQKLDLDIQFYKWVKDYFQRRVNEYGAEKMAKELKEFQQINKGECATERNSVFGGAPCRVYDPNHKDPE